MTAHLDLEKYWLIEHTATNTWGSVGMEQGKKKKNPNPSSASSLKTYLFEISF